MPEEIIKNKTTIGTRFFEREPDRIEIIENFVHRSLLCSSEVLVAINTEEDKTGALAHHKLKLPGVEVFGVSPWGKFIPALNMLISKAKLKGAGSLLLASAEMRFNQEQFSKLQNHLEQDTLVAGAVLPGHDFQEGEREGNGRTVPWNTFSLWNLEYLSRTGFPLISDAFFNGDKAGVEEVTTIALLQKMYPFLKAKLIQVQGIIRETASWDKWRLARHQRELENRISCPEAQMKVFNIPAPKIIHIIS